MPMVVRDLIASCQPTYNHPQNSDLVLVPLVSWHPCGNICFGTFNWPSKIWASEALKSLAPMLCSNFNFKKSSISIHIPVRGSFTQFAHQHSTCLHAQLTSSILDLCPQLNCKLPSIRQSQLKPPIHLYSFYRCFKQVNYNPSNYFEHYDNLADTDTLSHDFPTFKSAKIVFK